MGKQKKVISVETNDPNQPVIKLTISATVEVEILFDPTTVYFRDMNLGEERDQKVHLKNTSSNILHISSINPEEVDDMISVDLINRSPDWPIELKPEETLDLLVGFRYQQDKPRFSKQLKISYKGGEGNTALLRVYATQKPKPQKPQEQTESLPEAIEQEQDAQPTTVKPSPSNKVFPMPPPPPDMPPRTMTTKPGEKAPE